MARIIQDSDEDEEITISPIRKSNTNCTASTDSAVKSQQRDFDGGQTESIEPLKQNNFRAQQDSPGPPPHTKRSRAEELGPSLDVSLADMAPKKRTKTMHGVSQSPASCSAKQKPGRRKTMKTYGTSSKSDLFDSIEEDYAKFEDYRVEKDRLDRRVFASQGSSCPSLEVQEDRHCQLNQLPQRELSAGFPPPSSTVPNHTATQERIAEAMRDNAYDTEYQADRDWGETTIETLRDPASFTITDPPCSENKFPLNPNHGRSSPSPYWVPEQTPSSIASRRSRAHTTRETSISGPDSPIKSSNSSGPKRRSKTVHESTNELANDDIDLVSITTEKKTVTSKARMMNQSCTSPSNSKKRRRAHSKPAGDTAGIDEQLGSDDLAIGLPKERYVPRPSRSRSTRNVEHEDVDAQTSPANSQTQPHDAPIGFPKERYVPRPSRSRSQQVLEPGSVTMQPQMGSSGRRRSTRQLPDDFPVEPSIPHSAKVRKIKDMGFRGSQAERALENSDGHLENAVDVLLCGDQLQQEEHQEQTSNHATYSQDDEQPVFIHEDDADIAIDEHSPDENDGPSNESGHEHENPPNVEQCESKTLRHVEICPPNKKALAPSKKAAKRKRAKTTPQPPRQQHFVIEDSDDDDDELQRPEPDVSVQEVISSMPHNKRPKIEVEREHGPDEAPSPALIKKRGRARPKSIKKQQEEVRSVENDDGTDTEMHMKSEVEPKQDSPLKDVAGNALQHISPGKPHTINSASLTRNIVNARMFLSKTLPHHLPSKPEASKHEGSRSAQHSPLKKSSKIFRVGLSRKVRIAPLLRVVKNESITERLSQE